ncbi:hypothetical protein [Streptomyces sp. KR80]|uniref:hypothetical protein n=1 Tax=Streptomyces sp. KR80 TaxID=3457426 RepID=UPI003FD42DA4
MLHATRTAAAAVLAGAAFAVPAPLAAADPGDAGPSNIVVRPDTVEQGGSVTVTVDGRSCRGVRRAYDAIVESNAFARTQLEGMPHAAASVARPEVFAAVEPGRHTVAATCGGKTIVGGHFQVVRRGEPGAAGERDAAGADVQEGDGGAMTSPTAVEEDSGAAGDHSAGGEDDPGTTPRRDAGPAPRFAPGASPSVPAAVPEHGVRAGVGSSERVHPLAVGLGIGLVVASAVAVGWCLVRRRTRGDFR